MVVIGHVLAAVAYTVLFAAVIAGARRPDEAVRSRVRLAFLVAVAVSALWALLGASHLLWRPAWLPLAYELTDLARYAAWFVFAALILRASREQPPTAQRRPLEAIAIALLVANAVWIVAGPRWMSAVSWWSSYAPLVSLTLPAMGLVLVEQVSRSVIEDERWHIKPLAIGLGILFAFDLYLHSQPLLFGTVDTVALSVRPAVHALPMPLLFIAAKRHADWSSPVHVSRNAVFFTTALTLISVYLLVIAAIGAYMRHVDDRWGRGLALLLVFAALGALAWLMASASLRAKFRVMLGKNLFRYRFDYRREWLRLTESLAAGTTPQAMGEAIVRGLATMMYSPSGHLWTFEERRMATRMAAWHVDEPAVSVPMNDAFIARLREREWVFDLDACRSAPTGEEAALVPVAFLAHPRNWLIVPLLVAEELKGFVVLGRPHAAVDLNWETRDLLRTAGRQAAAFMALSHTSEALLEARKFEAFNRMSAFVVHDLKNVVAQQSLMLQNARRLKDNPEFQADMLATVENSVERMRRLLTQLREGESPVGVVHGVPLEPLFERIKEQARTRGRAVEVVVHASVSTRGHGDRVERVLGHLVDNALDATESKGEVRVTVRREGSQAVVEVQDSGKGMSADFLQNQLFKPFQTTKEQGMGIGAFESMQYVRELGGDLTVSSVEGKGTVVTVSLPLFHADAAARDAAVGLP